MQHITDADDRLITTFGRLVEAHAALTRRTGRSLEGECGVPQAWFEVLLRISRADGGQVSMGVLAQQVALTSGGVTRLLDRMIDAGLVQRVPCPTDRRVLDVLCTLALQGLSVDVEADTRRVALLAGVGRETARTGLIRLSRDGWIALFQAAAGPHGARWSISPHARLPCSPSPQALSTGA